MAARKSSTRRKGSSKRKPARRKSKTLTERVTALEKAILPKKSRVVRMKDHATPIGPVRPAPQYLGAYRLPG